jgi:hypothetical protein
VNEAAVNAGGVEQVLVVREVDLARSRQQLEDRLWCKLFGERFG